jgi:hypothetical protein
MPLFMRAIQSATLFYIVDTWGQTAIVLKAMRRIDMSCLSSYSVSQNPYGCDRIDEAFFH